MCSTPTQGDDDVHTSLSMIPAEVATNIFCQLPSFPDVYAQSAVCRRLRHLWLNGVNQIYNQVAPEVAPRSISCEPATRRFLADQDGPGLGSPLSAKDVVRMVQNAGVIGNAILQFEREIVSRIRMGSLSAQEFYGPGAQKHPPTLTRTERTRFIRSCYTLWSLMRLNPSEWDCRLQAMTSQELYYLWEMTLLTQSIGREEIVPPPRFPDESPGTVSSINSGRFDKRIALEQKLWMQIHRNSLQFLKRDARSPSVYAKHEGFLWFVAPWDHWQPSLKDMVCHQPVSLRQPSQAVQEQYLWNDRWDE